MLLTKYDHEKIFNKDVSVYTAYKFFIKLFFANEETLFHFPFLTPGCYKIIENFDIKYIGRLISEYSEIKTGYLLYDAFKSQQDIRNVLLESERIIILEILAKHGIRDSESQIKILNEVIYYFIFTDLIIFLKHKKLAKLRFVLKRTIEVQNFMAKLPNLSLLVTFFSKDDLFTNESELKAIKRINKSILRHLNEKLKVPVGNFTNPMTDYFISRLVDFGIEYGIKNHYTDFCIPVLKDLKKEFPTQFSNITSFSNKRLMSRVKLGRSIQEEMKT